MVLRILIGLFFIGLPLGIVHAQIDSMDDPIQTNLNIFEKLSAETKDLPALSARIEQVAELRPGLTFRQLLPELILIALPWAAIEISAGRTIERSFKNISPRQLMAWREKIDLTYQSAGYGVTFEKSRFVQPIKNLTPQLQQQIDNAEAFIKSADEDLLKLHQMARNELANINNPYARFLSQKILQIQSTDQNGKVRLLKNLFSSVDAKLKLYDRNLFWQKGARLAGTTYFVVTILNSFFSDSSDQGGLSILDTPLQKASVDMKNDFLLMITDSKGLGLSFEEAGYALTLACR